MSRRLGQIFLKNPHIRRNIAEYVLSLGADSLVEIGPGGGAITDFVYGPYTDNLTLVELDERLLAHLRESFPAANLIHNDILKTDFGHLDRSLRHVIFGNIPYYITSPIILKFLGDTAFSEAVFMVQEEYYGVLSARCRTGRYSCMSALVQTFADVRRVMDVDRRHFHPIPGVDSTVVHLIRCRNRDLNLADYSAFLRKCFGMPRKTLRNNLRRHFGSADLERILSGMGIGEKARPEELDHSLFVELFNSLGR